MQTQCVVCARHTAVGWSESHQQIFRSYSSRSLQDMFICWCNTLQDTATLCITLNQPVTAPDCNISVHDLLQVGRRGIYWSVDAIHCNALQRSASHCTSRHHSATNQFATYCSTPKQREKWRRDNDYMRPPLWTRNPSSAADLTTTPLPIGGGEKAHSLYSHSTGNLVQWANLQLGAVSGNLVLWLTDPVQSKADPLVQSRTPCPRQLAAECQWQLGAVSESI